MSLKDRKEAFVTGLSGGTTLDIYTVTSVSAVSYLVWCILKQRTQIFDHPRDFLGQLLDFLLNWNNMLLAVTVYSNNISLLLFLCVLPVLFVLFTTKSKPRHQRTIKINFKTLTPKQYLPFKSYITIYRAMMMILTCLCILAVDFPIFPRRFAKVETWGTSLMDLGVGSFAFSMGLITARAFLRQHMLGRYSYTRNLFKAVKGSLPILAMGFFRLASVKYLNYQEHVTEYGKYWNFFFTLGCLPFLTNFFAPLIFMLSPLALSLIIGLTYEYALVKGGLMEYIISAPRTDFLSDNREGIFSLFGYFGICLNGLALGSIVLTVVPAPSNLLKMTNSREDLLAARKNKSSSIFTLTPLQGLFFMSVLFHAIYYLGENYYYYGVSRRMTNFLYVIWVSAYNSSFLFGYKLIENFIWGEVKVEYTTNETANNDIRVIEQSEAVPISLTAVNSNSLVLFLFANILTGVVNMNYNTLDSSEWSGIFVLMGYTLVLSTLTMILYHLGIVLR
ncbi:DEKNAAC103462 [Brettanomyces naardenensis]|uniref:GPI-anchored wall transfer protein n=1 Tax=Brettanomyces naardenensis TaxID=13370 RepID=A0A448YNE2_BRENA|nr:DEKNAAC103462 [Brettanomyces naardenensis]